LEGDRHFDPTGAPPGGALTLVEEEIVDEVGQLRLEWEES
jgi:hypothetical protein